MRNGVNKRGLFKPLGWLREGAVECRRPPQEDKVTRSGLGYVQLVGQNGRISEERAGG